MSRILKPLLFAALIVTSLISYSATTVVSFNIAQLKKRGIDLVPCTNKRLPAIIDRMFFDKNSPLKKNDNFVIGLQEVFTKKAFDRISEAAKELGYFVFPKDYHFVRNSGLLTISNLAHLYTTKIEFNEAKYVKKSFLHSRLMGKDGKMLHFINTHTEYSPADKVNGKHLSQIKQLSEYMNELTQDPYKRIIMVGDFNSGPTTYAVKHDITESNRLWSQNFAPLLENSNMERIEIEGHSWDLKRNTLARKPVFAIKMFNLIKEGRTGWIKISEMVDHLFVSNNLSYYDQSLAFTEHHKFKCRGRADEDGKVPLSDHYGVMATLDLF